MRASTSSNDYRYYRDVGQIEHRRECDQPTLPAEEIEDQEDIAHRWEATGKAKQNGLLRKSRRRSPGRRHKADRRQANSTSVPLGRDSWSERGRRELASLRRSRRPAG